jgi:signal transduction histidine kinase
VRYPAFLEAMARPANRPKLYMGVWSGYVLSAAFALLAVAGELTEVVPHLRAFYLLLLLKLTTNTLALAGLRRDVLALELSGFNVVIDVVAMTSAIYLTGGPESPLFPIYVIEISVVALLTNLGITILIAGLAFVLYGGAVLLVHFGAAPAFPPPTGRAAAALTDAQVALVLGYAFFVIATPTLFVSAILRLLRRHELELERTNAALVDAAKQKSWFMANVTHELRTPIHGICGLTDLVEAGIYGPVTEEQREAQRSIKQSAKRLLGLIDDLLALARAEAGAVVVAKAEIGVETIVAEALSDVRAMLGTKKLELTAQVDAALPSLRTDGAKLLQILVNLLANAVKFTPEGGRIALRAFAAGGDVAFEIADTGVGIPEDELPRIFEVFRQVDGSDEREFGGAGLGLALVRHLVTALGGTVEVASEPGAGTRFTVRLPHAA